MTFSRTARVNGLIGAGHFLPHFYILCLPPLFLSWHPAFGVALFATAAGMLLFGWRGTLMAFGWVGGPVGGALLGQGGVLRDQRRPAAADKTAADAAAPRGAGLLLSRPILLFFGFFLTGSMAGSALQAWLITVLHEVNGLSLESASSALTGYVAGGAAGTLIGGWGAHRTARPPPPPPVLPPPAARPRARAARGRPRRAARPGRAPAPAE